MKKILISACLLGKNCRYDGKNNFVLKLSQLKDKYILIPICPEVMGGLFIPRFKSERKGDKVISETNQNVTDYFIKGARKALEIAKNEKVDLCILKENSPSCGTHFIHNGEFKGIKIKGLGVTSELLINNNFLCINENDELIDKLLNEEE